jgi:2-succinyl-6-hydroxy-2,4-cyclohexadiene-1-carboxylate synthase
MPLVESNGLALHVEERGAGPPLVLLHGFTGSACSWWPVIDDLSARYRTIAIDLIGHGQSVAPASASRYTFDRALDDLCRVAVALDIGGATWLGYSLGGRVALGLAVAYPDLVSALVLESATPGIAGATEQERRRSDDDELAARIERDGVAAFVARWERLPMWESQEALPAGVLACERGIRLANSARGLANSLRGMGQGAQPSLWDRLPHLQCPTLIIAGERDAKFARIAGEMHDALPDARVAIAPGTGHNVHLEAPAWYGERVTRFIDAAAGTPA